MDRWPEPPVHDGLVRVEPLRSELLELDTAAYAASPVAIVAHSAGRWPVGLTLAAERPPVDVVLGELLAWVGRWSVAPVALRVLPGEAASLTAARTYGLAEADGPAPHRWFVL